MESDSWSRIAASSTSRRHHHQSRYGAPSATPRDPNHRSWRDLFSGFEEIDFSGFGGAADEESRGHEFSCPFCAEDFDVVGLCCHIDEEHPIEVKNGVCPICTGRVGTDLVGHMLTQHGNYFKMQRRRKFRKGSSASQTMLSYLKRDIRDSSLQAFLGGSSFMAPATAAPDPLLSSLIYNLPIGESSKDTQPESLDEESLMNRNLNKKAAESNEPSLSAKDQKERALRSEFVQNLVLSTVFDDCL